MLTAQIFDNSANQNPDKVDEVQLTHAIANLNERQRVFAKRIEGKRYEVGNLMGYIDLSLQYGLKHPETEDGLRDYLIQLSQTLRNEK